MRFGNGKPRGNISPETVQHSDLLRDQISAVPVKRVQLQGSAVPHRDAVGVDLEDAGAVMLGGFNKAHISPAFIVFIFIKIKSTGIHILPLVLSLFSLVYSQEKRKRTADERDVMEEKEKDCCGQQQKIDEKYMRQALRQAEKAYALNETPIGCVIVHDGKVIGRGYNRRNTDKNPLAHAEITAIRKASKMTGDWRLEECTLYVTLEPCQMCAGAIVQSRIKRVVVGCMNPKAGCAGSVLNLLDMKAFNHQAELETGVLGEECSVLMKKFFKELRAEQKIRKKSEADIRTAG